MLALFALLVSSLLPGRTLMPSPKEEVLPVGSAPAPVSISHFPDRLHAFVWRNWSLVPTDRLARVVGARPEEVRALGAAMGLPPAQPIPANQWKRSYLTIIRRNWHLLPYDQLLTLLGWTKEQLAYTLQEDDFLYIKLGSLKPNCPPIRYAPPDAQTKAREAQIANIVNKEFPSRLSKPKDPLFSFVDRLSRPLPRPTPNTRHLTPSSRFSPRFCYSYFALYGDPLLDKDADPYPDGYLARLAEAGVDGVWLQAVLYKLAPFPWDPTLSARYTERLAALRALVKRARKHGIGIYLYMNEPRSMPLAFFTKHPELKGVVEGEYATLCTSHPDVQRYVSDSVASICRAVPDLAGYFTITASENLTNCWSHHRGDACPRCGKRGAEEVIPEVDALIQKGIRQAGTSTRLIAWDWGWPDAKAEAIINRLPQECALMSVSEWSLPITRGGIASEVGEYSLSSIGPGPRAQRHWTWARKRGLKTFAKIQAACSWEMSAVPYVPALENTARHAANLNDAHLDGLMLGWTLGGYPSPNLEVVAEMGRIPKAGATAPSPDSAMEVVAKRRFGEKAAPIMVRAWKSWSAAYREYPYHISVVYNAPVQLGPANLLWAEPTGYHGTMVGFPYDDLELWRGPFPPEVFAGQFARMADSFGSRWDETLNALREADIAGTSGYKECLSELNLALVCKIHFDSVANQVRFIEARRKLSQTKSAEATLPLLKEMEDLLKREIAHARRLYELQREDSRVGFEASNQYYYVPLDLAEKVLNCRDLLDRWLPAERAKRGL